MRTIDEALTKFRLVDGAGDKNTGKACVMTLMSWVAGEAWSDRPRCAHRWISQLAIAGNDHPDTTPGQRAEIVRAGETGILDTWWIPDTVVAAGLAQAPQEDPVAQVLSVLAYVTAWKSSKHHPDLRYANLQGTNLGYANLGGANLGSANLGYANLGGADLRDANLQGTNLGYANLRGANLRYANLQGTNLGYADLRGADLRDANLWDANLGGANLWGADLRYADLRYANLWGADLGGANLRDADLRSANLWGADLRSANLRSANLWGADLRYADLRGAVGEPWSGMPPGWGLADGNWVSV